MELNKDSSRDYRIASIYPTTDEGGLFSNM